MEAVERREGGREGEREREREGGREEERKEDRVGRKERRPKEKEERMHFSSFNFYMCMSA